MTVLKQSLMDMLNAIKPKEAYAVSGEMYYASGCTCKGDCGYSCEGNCAGDCAGGCAGDCAGSCYGGCEGSCSRNCAWDSY